MVKAFSDAEATIEVHVGDEFQIALTSHQASSGFARTLVGAAPPSAIETVSHAYHAPSTVVPGAPGQDVWTFRAKSPGPAKITFRSARSWEPATASESEFTVHVSA